MPRFVVAVPLWLGLLGMVMWVAIVVAFWLIVAAVVFAGLVIWGLIVAGQALHDQLSNRRGPPPAPSVTDRMTGAVDRRELPPHAHSTAHGEPFRDGSPW